MTHTHDRITHIRRARVAVVHLRCSASNACSRAVAGTCPIAHIAIVAAASRADRNVAHTADGITRVGGTQIFIIDDQGISVFAGTRAIAGLLAVAYVVVSA